MKTFLGGLRRRFAGRSAYTGVWSGHNDSLMRTAYFTIGSLLLLAGVVTLASGESVLRLNMTLVSPAIGALYICSGGLAIATALAGVWPMRVAGRILGILFAAVALTSATVDAPWASAVKVDALLNVVHGILGGIFLYFALLASPPRR